MSAVGRRLVLLLPLLGLPALPAAARAADSAAVTAPVVTLDNGLVAIMRAGSGTSFVQRYQMLQPVILRSFDLPYILRVSVGPGWDSTPTQMQGLLYDEFVRYTVASYVANFKSYEGQRFDVAPTLRQVGANQVVQTNLVSATDNTRIDYVLRDEGGNWRIVDVLLDGTISRVAVQRSDFREIFSSSGAQGLIGLLRRKVTELSGGAMQ
jgi:phospholipid transport system substrate-binding protein